MKKIVKAYHGGYYTGKFETGGVVIMISHSDQLEDAMKFDTEEEIKEELKNVNNYEYTIEEVE